MLWVCFYWQRGRGWPIKRAPVNFFREAEFKMAKKNTIKLKMVNPETGYFYMAERNPKKQTEKLKKRKYDPTIRKHAMFEEKRAK